LAIGRRIASFKEELIAAASPEKNPAIDGYGVDIDDIDNYMSRKVA
jgi:hypothetical protein